MMLLTDKYFPRGDKILSVDYPMYSAVRIEDGILYFDAYQVTDSGSERVDSFAIQKDTAQGDVNTEYVEPEVPSEEKDELSLTLSRFLEIIFRILRVLLNIVDIYII